MGGVLARRPSFLRRGWTAASRVWKGLAFRPLLGLRGLVWIGISALIGWGMALETRAAFVQSTLLSRWAEAMTFVPRPGPSAAAHFPGGGPYDQRLGYSQMPDFLGRLARRGYAIERQAGPSPALTWLLAHGGYPPCREKDQAGFTLYDRAGAPIHEARHPSAIYRDFADIAPLVVNTLLFIEDHHLLDPDDTRRDPAIDWKRFLLAAAGRVAGLIDPHLRRGGASTLATQIEKFRHSPTGRTEGIGEKFRQMLSAALRAYRDGPETLEARRRVVTTYLNSTPLASRPGYGEVTGIGDGLQAWFGTDLAEANQVLKSPTETPAALARKAEIYRQVLSLLLAERRPTDYLRADGTPLQSLANHYLRRLADAGVIDAKLRDAALRARPRVRPEPPSFSYRGDKATDALRIELLNVLDISSLYDLDRLDLTGFSTIDAAAQKRVTEVLARLNDQDFVEAHHLVGFHLLHTDRDLKVNYSVVVYERGADRDSVRVHADSLDEPFDINSGAKLILGSTAKLRTLATYLGIVAALYHRYADRAKPQLAVLAKNGRDPLTRWTATWLAGGPDRGLQPMLDAAMQRRYSANPGQQFFTGGGAHVFHNFEPWEDATQPTVEYAFENSINLAFIRLMRDITQYFVGGDEDAWRMLADPQDVARDSYLRRFADEEGRKFVNRFYDEYRALGPAAALALIGRHGRPGLDRRVVLFRSVQPVASVADLSAFLTSRSPTFRPDDEELAKLYDTYGPDRLPLADRAYLAGVHPLEIWVASYLIDHPGAARTEVLERSASVRQEAYGWLFQTHSRHKQDVRLRILLEEDAFGRIFQEWQRLGYPFGHLVPSLATAIGSSGDRPDALGQLIGIILDGGVRKPLLDLDRLEFARATPYETDVDFHPDVPERVMAPEVAATIRRALRGVVTNGTAKGLQGAYLATDGHAMAVGGKTGTGDNRFETFTKGGGLVSSRPVDRTATFVFFLGDRFFGTVTAYVAGSQAGRYRFTSALAVQVLKVLEPALAPLIGTAEP
ncbi:MAG: transglycosylase domain-containing protein [Pseudomonadota bacterium]|nr:transglycosylase domain-containing protein [Pseudomonadota bacterium]